MVTPTRTSVPSSSAANFSADRSAMSDQSARPSVKLNPQESPGPTSPSGEAVIARDVLHEQGAVDELDAESIETAELGGGRRDEHLLAESVHLADQAAILHGDLHRAAAGLRRSRDLHTPPERRLFVVGADVARQYRRRHFHLV